MRCVETGRFAVHTELDLPRDRSNLVVRAFEALAPADEFEFRITSQIPLSGGLGSSAAAIVAGLTAADHLFELSEDIYTHAVEIEGHPDNVAAALHGGFVICDGPAVRRIPTPLGLEAVLVVPDEAVRTAQARAALPAQVPLADAVANIAAASTLTLGLATEDWELIAAGLRDTLHQPHRAHLYPRSAQLVAEATSLGALGATISGAGPTILVWCHCEQTGTVIEQLASRTDRWAAVLRAPFAAAGADVREL